MLPLQPLFSLPLLLQRSIVVDVLALADEEGALEEFKDFVDEADSSLVNVFLNNDMGGGKG
jgi:hypothetical protein